MPPGARSLEGRPVPSVPFKIRADNQWKDVTTDAVFKGRTVVEFGRPGRLFPGLREPPPAAPPRTRRGVQGQRVDEIGCTSTNDASVMNDEWQQDQGAEDNTLLPGGPNTLPALSGRGTWPQVYIGGKLIGNADEPEAYFGARKAA